MLQRMYSSLVVREIPARFSFLPPLTILLSPCLELAWGKKLLNNLFIRSRKTNLKIARLCNNINKTQKYNKNSNKLY